MARAPFYRGVRGSAALATRRLAEAAPAAEALEPGEMRRVPYGGELLGAVRVRAGYAALPLDAFDRASARLEAEEQAAYLHLLRLSVGEGRNWCRAAKKDLVARLRLSDRRLLRVLDALVAKGFARPLHRDNRGTLWRVFLPREAFGEPLGDDVLVGRATELKLVRGRAATSTPTPTSTSAPTSASTSTSTSTSNPTSNPTSTSNPTANPTATATPTSNPTATSGALGGAPRRGPRPVHTEASLARALAAARGRSSPEDLATAVRDVRELLAEGQAPERIAASIETVRRRAARARMQPEESP